MSYLKVWVHLVFATKGRRPLLGKGIRETVFNHMYENAKKKAIQVKVVGGHLEHVHVLFSMQADQSIGLIAQLIKGESSFWMNKNSLVSGKFEWQDDYYAASVSESGIRNVAFYIKNQEEHHKTQSFEEEFDEFIKKYNFDEGG